MKKQNWLYKLVSRLCNRNKKQTFPAVKHKILTFSEYRIANALVIQEQLQKSKNPLEFSFIERIIHFYFEYLYICGIDKSKFFADLQYKINDRYVSYDKNIHDNLTDIMDHITDTDYLFKNYKL